ncbi:MAG: TonB-dependent receptor, partial [Gammaproteobacteria bacterium]|nr:TonB-dependent receptor [Gammaproteobacteria bacterium]
PGLSALGLGAGPPLGEANFDDTKASFSSDPRLDSGDDLTQLELHMVTGTLNYDFGATTLTSVTNYATSDHTNNLDFDFDNKDANVFARTENYWQVSEELRLASNGGEKFDYLVGLFFFHSEWDLVQDNVWGIPDFPPAPGPTGQIFNGSYTNTFVQDTTAYSAFGQVNWYVTDRFRANVGLRFTHEKKEVSFGRTNRAPFTIWNSVVQAPFPFQQLNDVTDDLVSGSVSLQYDLTDDAMVYVAASRGGKAGGYGEFNSIALDPVLGTGNPQRDAFIDDERANTYEIGVKSNLLDGRMQFDLTAFHIDVWGLQQLVFTGEFASSNDRASSTGIEGLLIWQMTDAFRLTASGTYADAEDKDNKQDLAQSPRVSAAVSANWERVVFGDWTLGLGGTVKHRSSKFNQLGEGLPEESYTTLALTARIDSDVSPWFANIVADNVTNATGADFGFVGPDPFVNTFETLAPLRSIKLSIGRRF